jgi:hypothetical protein
MALLNSLTQLESRQSSNDCLHTGKTENPVVTLAQESGTLRTRGTHDASPLKGRRPRGSLESRWFESVSKFCEEAEF